jgi:hypothetical protein
MGILSWILLGLIAGALAKLLMPGKDGGGWIATILLDPSVQHRRRLVGAPAEPIRRHCSALHAAP